VQIKWDELAQVAAVSLAFAVGIVVVFSFGVLSAGRGSILARTSAGIAFTLCAVAAAYGLYLLIPQFH
jgi:hypothetical protein